MKWVDNYELYAETIVAYLTVLFWHSSEDIKGTYGNPQSR